MNTQRNQSSANSSVGRDALESDEDLLELVLNETRSQEEVLPIIVSFAARNGERRITEPIVAEALIQEILQKRLRRQVLPGECLQWIASTILEDPDSRERLVDLWKVAKSKCQ